MFIKTFTKLIATALITSVCCALAFISCDAYNVADVKIVNKSQYDLLIEFKREHRKDNHYSGWENIELLKNDSASMKLVCYIGNSHIVDPNDDYASIVFSDLNTSEIIIERINNEKYFQFIEGDTRLSFYLIKITDDMLQGITYE